MRAAILAVAVAVAGCAAPSPRETFDAEVLPILARRCAATACHGVAPDAAASGERFDAAQLLFHLDARGRIADVTQAYVAARRAINTVEGPEVSTLLRKPLAVAAGGLGHFGGGDFASPRDRDYRAIAAWIALEADGGEDPPPLTDGEQRFAATVQPVLAAATCMTSRCHGATAGAIPYQLDEGYQGRFTAAATRHNYRASLAMLSLDGDPAMSRLLRKSRPLGAGIVHKGGNFDFYAGDPGGAADAIVAWACAERRARTSRDCAPDATAVQGLVYVRGPLAPAHPFALDTFTPGSDLYLAAVAGRDLAVGAVTNLTATLHPDGPADVRDPAVSRDGTQVLFAMRTSAAEGHHLWVIDLTTRAARQLTFAAPPAPGGGVATDRDPTWGPDGSVWFASTRAGVVADQGRLLDAELYALDPATGATRRWTFTPHVERKPTFFDVGEEAGGEVGFSALRDAIPGQARAHVFRFPPSLATEYHQHFGVTPLASLTYDMRELPDGRYAAVSGELSAQWAAGALAIVDRNLGPEINARAASAVPALEQYRAPMTIVAADGGYRDPAPLPDGRVLVAHQPAPFAADDPTAIVTPRIELLELVEAADGGGPRVARATVIVAEAGVALTDPEPVVVRAPVRSDAPPLAQDLAAPALFRHQGLPMIAGLLANLAPSGQKHPLAGIAAVRLVEAVPATPAERRPAAGDVGATSAALGRHGVARILAELPVAADGSFQAEVPPGVAFRLQPLDRDGMAIGPMHNRWYYALPGQVITQGLATATDLRRYGSRCAACHGDAGGADQPPALEPPDAVTTASLSLSRYERQDPRRPIAAPVVGPATRVEVDFRRDVQPILDRRCVRCHGAIAPAGGLALDGAPTADFTRAYVNLLRSGAGSGHGRAYVDDDDGRARASFLIELVTGRELDAPRALVRPGLPHPGDAGEALTADEVRTLVRWIELGATFRGVGGAP